MRMRRKASFGPSRAPAHNAAGVAPPITTVDHHHATTGTMSSASRPKSLISAEGETFGSPQAPELQQSLSSHLDEVPSNSESDPSPELEGEALPQGRRKPVLVAPDVPMDASALEVASLTQNLPRRASRRRADWTPPDGLQMIVKERKSGRSKGNKDTYYTLPGVSTKFRSIPEVQRYLKQKPVRIWRKLSQNSGARPSQPIEARSSSIPSDPQPAAESSPREPKEEIIDEERAE